MKVGDLVEYRWAGAHHLALVLKLEKKPYSMGLVKGIQELDSALLLWVGGGTGPQPNRMYEEIPGHPCLVPQGKSWTASSQG